MDERPVEEPCGADEERADGNGILRLRQALAEPDRQSWRRLLPRREAYTDERTGDDRQVRRPPAIPARLTLRLLALSVLGAAAIVVTSALRPPGGAPTPARPGAPTSAQPAGVGRPAAADPSAGAPSSSLPARVWPADPPVVDGTTVRLGEASWAVGAPGDVVVVGDWDCDGESTPAVLRPSTGGFYVFDTWADEGEVVARPVAHVAGARTVEPAGCGASVLVDAEGVRHEVVTAAEGPR